MIPGAWQVTSLYIGDQKKFAVYHLLDVNAIDHSGNREFATVYLTDKAEAERIAAELNEKEAGE